MKNILVAVRVLAVMTVVCGLVYPLAIELIAQVAFPYRANGSLIVKNGRVIGSRLIGQLFTSDRYFHGRPSTVDYDAAGSGASNYGPTNRKLADEVKSRVGQVRAREHVPAGEAVPADLVTASASGLDPHLTLPAARLQIPRIARTRHIPHDKIEHILQEHLEYRMSGIHTDPYVNVLTLNLELDGLQP